MFRESQSPREPRLRHNGYRSTVPCISYEYLVDLELRNPDLCDAGHRLSWTADGALSQHSTPLRTLILSTTSSVPFHQFNISASHTCLQDRSIGSNSLSHASLTSSFKPLSPPSETGPRCFCPLLSASPLVPSNKRRGPSYETFSIPLDLPSIRDSAFENNQQLPGDYLSCL